MRRNAFIFLSAAMVAVAFLREAPAEPKTPPATAPDGELLKPAPEKPRRGGGGGGGGGEGRPRDPRQAIFRTDVPDHPVDVILSRVQRESVTISIMAGEAADVRVEIDQRKVPVGPMAKGDVRHVLVDRLAADRAYSYKVLLNDRAAAEGTFHTARPAGSTYRFTVQADSHLDGGTVPAVYTRTLTSVLADKPDFHLELGDTFMNDKYPAYRDSLKQYIAQRYYFGLACHSVPFYFVMGNHDGEGGWRVGGERNNGISAWSTETRKKYFANPFPDGFYTGNKSSDDPAKRLENYYGWTWGDALFLVLDPFAYTTSKPRGDDDGWAWTLGREQYDWMRTTLAKSDARFKFVFLHHLVGGIGKDARGGVEGARNFEWGGHSVDGKRDFDTRRPGWEAPIHDLLVKHHVTAVFHGHDHLYDRQSLDGVAYIEVPQPSHPAGNNVAKMAEEYGYKSGVIHPSPGYVRVSVGPETSTLEYLRSDLDPADPKRTADRCELKPNPNGRAR